MKEHWAILFLSDSGSFKHSGFCGFMWNIFSSSFIRQQILTYHYCVPGKKIKTVHFYIQGKIKTLWHMNTVRNNF
jgi:hypothetical protein